MSKPRRASTPASIKERLFMAGQGEEMATLRSSGETAQRLIGLKVLP
jgi:hypothetical protein